MTVTVYVMAWKNQFIVWRMIFKTIKWTLRKKLYFVLCQTASAHINEKVKGQTYYFRQISTPEVIFSSQQSCSSKFNFRHCSAFVLQRQSIAYVYVSSWRKVTSQTHLSD